MHVPPAVWPMAAALAHHLAHLRPAHRRGLALWVSGTILAQSAWLPVLRTLGAELWSRGRLLVSRAQTVFGEDGAITDPKIKEQLGTFLRGFAAFARSSRRGPPA